MADQKDKCIFCDKPVTDKNSPSESSKIGDYKMCDPCVERLIEKASSNSKDTKK